MKKMIKFMSLLLVMTVMFASMIDVKAEEFPEAPKEITFTSSTQFPDYQQILFYWKVKGNHRWNNVGSTYKTAKVGNTTINAYCFNMEEHAPTTPSPLTKRELTENEEKNEGAFVYILQNGYGLNPNFGSTLKSKSEKYYATQVAIWALQGSLTFDNLKQSTVEQKRIYNEALNLYTESKKHNGYIDPKITIAAANNKMTKTADNQFYRSQDITVGGLGYKTAEVALVNVPSDVGAEIVLVGSNKSLGTKGTLNLNDKFYVRIPVSKVNKNNYNMSPKLVVGATSTQTRLTVYESSQADTQDVGVPVTITKKVDNELALQLSAPGAISVKKVELKSDGTKQDLKDVTIRILDSKGVEIVKWNTKDENPKVVNNLVPGEYTVEEISAPEGYIKSGKVTVTVEATVTETVELVNTKDEVVLISKQDATTGTELPGAHLVLKTWAGELVEEWDSTDTPHMVKLQPNMKYTLSETIAPKGYQATTKTISFTTNATGGVDEPVVMENIPVTSVKISKVDITNQKELPGATLQVIDSNGKVVHQWVSTSKPHYLPETIAPGTYTLKETIAPEGYLLSEETITFTITADGIEQTVTMTNEPIPETAGNNVTLIIVGLVATVLLAGFSIFKINKQNA